ncbi:MAG TPA: glycosyltransferase [Gemmatimonadales bacterium]|nr:glycosyltransferase [Gemmatimonadales bacterium]
MRLLLVIDEENLGGAELSFLELSRSLARQAEVHLALSQSAWTSHPHAYAPLPGQHVAVHRCSRALYPGTLANLHPLLREPVARELAALIRNIDPAAVLVNLPTVERGQSVVDAARRVSADLPIWGLLHLVQQPSGLGTRLGLVRDRMVVSLLTRFDRLLTVSKAGALQLAGRYALPMPAVIHPPTAALQSGIAQPERQTLRARHNLPPGFLLGVVGRVQLRQKGQDAALRITAQLLRDDLPVHLVVIGDGPDLAAIKRLAERMGIDSRVTFLGWRQDAGDLIPLLDAVLLPSHFEGLPQTALQAASAGVPVVAYAVDGLTELLPPQFLVPHGDEAGFTRALREVIHGSRVWPEEEMRRRAVEWGDPGRAAARVVELLGGNA